jgi:hypothetical protein
MSRRDLRAQGLPLSSRLGIAAAAAAVTLTLGIGAARAQAPGAEIGDRARAVLAGDDYQTEHPGRAKFAPPIGGGGLGDLPFPTPGGGGQSRDKRPGESSESKPPTGDPDPSASKEPSSDKPGEDRSGGANGPGGDRSGNDNPRGGNGDRGWSTPSRPRSSPPPVVDPGGPSMFGLVAMSLLGAVLVLLLVLGASQFLRSREKAGEDGVVEGDEPILGGGGAAQSSLSEVDALALEGRFAEAVHALFQITVSMLARGGRLVVEDAMTGREALGRARLDDGGRTALRDLVVVVEHSLFGGGAVSLDQYRRCVASYQQLAAAGAPTGPTIGAVYQGGSTGQSSNSPGSAITTAGGAGT